MCIPASLLHTHICYERLDWPKNSNWIRIRSSYHTTNCIMFMCSNECIHIYEMFPQQDA